MDDLGHLSMAYLAIWSGLLAATLHLLWRTRQAQRTLHLMRDIDAPTNPVVPLTPPPAWLYRALMVAGALVVPLQALILFAIPLVEPETHSAPYSQKLFYLHVPLALASYLLFVVVFVNSVQYLRHNHAIHDLRSRAASQLGVWCAGLALLSGALWASAEWGYYWRPADLKLTVYLALFMVYLALVVLRANTQDLDHGARIAAIYGVVAFTMVPLSALSVHLNRSSLHGGPRDLSISVPVGALLGLSLLVMMTVIYLLFTLAVHVGSTEEQVLELQMATQHTDLEVDP